MMQALQVRRWTVSRSLAAEENACAVHGESVTDACAAGDTTHIPHPSDGDPRYFLAAFFARTTTPPSGMVSSHERRDTKHLRPWRVVWVSCSRLSKRTKSNICPL